MGGVGQSNLDNCRQSGGTIQSLLLIVPNCWLCGYLIIVQMVIQFMQNAFIVKWHAMDQPHPPASPSFVLLSIFVPGEIKKDVSHLHSIETVEVLCRMLSFSFALQQRQPCKPLSRCVDAAQLTLSPPLCSSRDTGFSMANRAFFFT